MISFNKSTFDCKLLKQKPEIASSKIFGKDLFIQPLFLQFLFLRILVSWEISANQFFRKFYFRIFAEFYFQVSQKLFCQLFGNWIMRCAIIFNCVIMKVQDYGFELSLETLSPAHKDNYFVKGMWNDSMIRL